MVLHGIWYRTHNFSTIESVLSLLFFQYSFWSVWSLQFFKATYVVTRKAWPGWILFRHSSLQVIRIISKSAFDAHTEPIFKQLKIVKLSDLYRSQIGNYIVCFLLRKAFFLMHSVRCFCWLIKFIIIILETPTPFTCFLVEQISDSLQ